MPQDFVCIWNTNTSTSLDVSNKRHLNDNRTEKLFMLNPQKYGLNPYIDVINSLSA